MDNTVLRMEFINKTYFRKPILQDLNMSVYQGDIYAFIGENGAGKTTTMRIIMSMIKQSSGRVMLFDQTDSKPSNCLYERIGAVIESPAFYPNLSAYNNLKYYSIFKGITDKSVIVDTLQMVGLENTGRKKFKNFSLGMKQRLGLALALLNRPDLLILDEPFNGLDPMGIIELRETIRVLNKKHGTTIIISSHILNELEQIVTRYGFIDHGKIIQEVSAEQLKEKCKTYIILEVSDSRSAVSVLEKKLPIKDMDIITDTTIHIYDRIDSEIVTNCLYQNSIGIKKIQEYRSSLEEYFLTLIQKGRQ